MYRFTTDVADRAGNQSAQAAVTFAVSPPVAGPRGTIVGQVVTGDVCNRQPLPGARVRLVHSSGVAITDTQGKFSLSAPPGLVWLEVDKPGFLSVQRSVRVVDGHDATLPVLALFPQDSKVTRVIAAAGGIVTDSTGNASLEIPPGALREDTPVTMTLVNDPGASAGPPLRNFIPGIAVRINPTRVTLNQFAIVRIKNTLRMPVHPITAYSWNDQTQMWDRVRMSLITPDGQFFQFLVDHFSGGHCSCGPLGQPGGGGGGGGGGGCCAAGGTGGSAPT
jgi:hypothetical protein